MILDPDGIRVGSVWAESQRDQRVDGRLDPSERPRLNTALFSVTGTV
jgi:hypothetical protein